jgi:hypothetical protein
VSAKLLEPFNRSALPRTLDRRGRVALLLEVMDELLGGPQASHDAHLFVGGAISAWLERGGSLERDHLRVIGRRGSHARRLRRRAAIADTVLPLCLDALRCCRGRRTLTRRHEHH